MAPARRGTRRRRAPRRWQRQQGGSKLGSRRPSRPAGVAQLYRGAGAGGGGGGASAPTAKLVEELHEAELRVTATLEANRGLVEAYWRVRMLAEEASRLGQPLSLPSHEELHLSALVMPGSHGRRMVPSELEKAIMREKEAMENMLTTARSDLLIAQQSLQQQATANHREVATLQKELDATRAQAGAHKSEASRLQDRVDELEVAVPAAKNAELVAQLRKTQAELIHQLTELKVEGAEWARSRRCRAAPSGADGGEDGGAPSGLVELVRRENDDLKEQLEKLSEQLALAESGRQGTPGGGVTDVGVLRVQMKELEAYQLELERDNAKLKRSLTFANEQLETMKQYVDTYLPKYQKEIMRLKQKARDTAKAFGQDIVNKP